jgi:hypothetical protein
MDATTRAIIGLVRSHAMHADKLAEEYLRLGDTTYAPIFVEQAHVAHALLEDVIYQASLREPLRPLDMGKYANDLLAAVAQAK